MVNSFEEMIQALDDKQVFVVRENVQIPELVGRERIAVMRDGNRYITVDASRADDEEAIREAQDEVGLHFYNASKWKFENGVCTRYGQGEPRVSIEFR